MSLDLMYQDISAPAVQNSLRCIPESLLCVFQFFDQGNIVVPRQLCKGLLHNCQIRPSFRKGPHVLEVPSRKTFHIGQIMTESKSKTVYEFGVPTLLPLLGTN